MNAVAFDTLAFSKRLQEAGVPAKQAEAQATAQADFLTHHLLSEVATKGDLKTLEVATKAGLQALEVATKADLQTLRGDMKAWLAELETRLTVQIMKAAALQFVLLGGLMAIFKFVG